MKKRVLSIAFGLLLGWGTLVPVFAYTSPGSPTGFVNDYTGTLSAEQDQVLESKLSQFKTETTNEIAVVVVSTIRNDTIENYANELFREWGIGGKEYNNGILVLIAKDDRQARIEVGYGLEGAVPDLLAKQILDNEILFEFRNQGYFFGIDQGIDALMAATHGEYTASPDPAPGISIKIFDAFFLFLFFLGPVFAALLGKSKSWWAGGVVGGGFGLINVLVNFFALTLFINILLGVGAIVVGLIFDYVVSKNYGKGGPGGHGPWFFGGGGFGSGRRGGGFGGFGGGSSGGGGASSSW